MFRLRNIMVLGLAIGLTLGSPSTAGADPVALADPSDPGMEAVVEEFPGDLHGPFAERYLLEESSSHAETELPHIASWPAGPFNPHPYATKRWADGAGWFTYRLPVSPGTAAPLRLTMVTKGELIVSVDGTTILNTGNTGEGDYTPREFRLTDPSLWSDGHVDVRFADADPSDGWGPNLYSLELGPTSSLRKRIEALEFGSTLVWNHGLPDGTANEFRGQTADVTVGTAWEQAAPAGTITLRWNQQVKPGTRYVLLVAGIGRLAGGWNHVSGTQSVDVAADGSIESSMAVGGEKIADLDVTDRVAATGNIVRITLPQGARLDFAALVAVPATPAPLDDQPMYFGGNEQADNFTRLIGTSQYFTATMLNDKSSGFIDSSMLNGAFANTLFIADFGPALIELFQLGYHDRAREAVDYAVADATGHYEQDIAAGNYIFATMLGLLRVDGYDAQAKATYWPRVSAGMARLGALINENSLHLVKGTNVETSSGSLGIYSSATSYYTLLSAAEAADRVSEPTLAAQWRAWAQTLAGGMNANLVWPTGAQWLGRPMTAGTWRYGRMPDGSDPATVHAGWHAVGSAKDIYYGLLGDDPAWRQRTDATLNAHMAQFWPDWLRSGNNKGFGTDYGVLSERGGWPLNSLLEGDRIGDATKNLGHIIFNSTDRNFKPFGKNEALAPDNAADYSEWSPYLIIRETDPQDRGSSASVGNGPGSEDLNLVEYILFMKNARLIAGVDAQLHGASNLKLAPRLPWTWNRVGVNNQRVSIKDPTGAFTTAELSFDYTRTEREATMKARTDVAAPGVQVRLGPFPLTTTAASVTVDGQAVQSTLAASGDAKWVTVTTNLGPTDRTIKASTTDPTLVATPPLAAVSEVSTVGGQWSAAGGLLQGSSPQGDAWAFLSSPQVTDGAVRANVVLRSGNAVGVSLRGGTGAQGYDLILDRVDGVVKLAKRPYVVLAQRPMPVNLERTYRLELRAVGNQLFGYVDGVEVLRVTDSTYASGKAGVFGYRSEANFRWLVVKQ